VAVLLLYKMSGIAALAFAVGGLIAAISLHDGAIVAAAVSVVVAAWLTARSKVGAIWREDAEGQRAAKEHLQETLTAERLERVEFEKQQQLLRHDLKDEMAGIRLKLQAAEVRTDLTTALDTIREMNATTVKTVTDAISKALEERDGQIHAVLVQILDQLKATGGTP